MLEPQGSRTATSAHRPASTVTPNRGRWLNRLFPNDVLVSDLAHLADRVAHRIGANGEPACPAYSSTSWDRVDTDRARRNNASPCHEPACYPQGWSA